MLVLFDIDGTLLLKAHPEHRDALHDAIRRVYGVEIPPQRVEAAGRTDMAIARSILVLAGLTDEHISERVADLRAACTEEYAKRAPADLSDRIAPGVEGLLWALADRDGVRLALLTGNLEPVARLKLSRAGLGEFFEHGQGAFGSDSEDRTALPALARKRAGKGPFRYPRERTVIIGDTPLDVTCARADGVRCVAVTTGPYRATDLAGADAIVSSAEEVLEALDGLAMPA